MKNSETVKASEHLQVVNDTLSSLNTFAGNSSYHELGETHVKSVHPLEQLETNLEMLTQIRSRLQFMLREVRYVLKVD